MGEELLVNVPQDAFERAVMAFNDRAFEEEGYLPILWETVQGLALPSWAQKRVYDSASAGRKDAVVRGDQAEAGDKNDAKEFVSRWIDTTIRRLAHATHGTPSEALTETAAAKLFHALLKKGMSLPILLQAKWGAPPKGWPFVDYAVRAAYSKHTHRNEDKPSKASKSAAKAARGRGQPKVERERSNAPRPKRRRASASGSEAGDEAADGIKGESGDDARMLVKSSDEEYATEVVPTLAKEEECQSDDEESSDNDRAPTVKIETET